MTQMSFTLYIFHFFSSIYKNGSFLFISYFDGDGRGGGGELRIKKTWTNDNDTYATFLPNTTFTPVRKVAPRDFSKLPSNEKLKNFLNNWLWIFT